MSRLTKPTTALGRIQDLAGMAQGIARNDRGLHRQAQLQSVLREIFDIALASRCGDPLPEPRDHRYEI